MTVSYVNKGDYGYWKGTESILDFDKNKIAVDRDFFVNGEAMGNVIFPANPLKDYAGDIVPIGDNEGQNFAYAWWRDGKDPEARMAYGRLKAKGYDFATTEGFKLVRESWFVENGRICFGDTVLMACTAERYDAEEAKDKKRNAHRYNNEIEQIDHDFSNAVVGSTHSTGIKLEPITETKVSQTKRK
jgi:hypothetical protein